MEQRRQPILLGVNIDHCATLREARYRHRSQAAGGVVEPDPVAFAQAAERAGADGITVHPREDARHIQREDVVRLRDCLQVPLNLEMAATADMLAFALELRPACACLVPEKREELTTEGGLDVVGNAERVGEITRRLQAQGTAVSLFIDPEPAQVRAAAELGAHTVELHTGTFANADEDRAAREAEVERLHAAARQAHEAGLVVHLGHGINYANVRWMREVPHVLEMNIGHSILSRAVFAGIDLAIRDLKRLMNPGLC